MKPPPSREPREADGAVLRMVSAGFRHPLFFGDPDPST